VFQTLVFKVFNMRIDGIKDEGIFMSSCPTIAVKGKTSLMSNFEA